MLCICASSLWRFDMWSLLSSAPNSKDRINLESELFRSLCKFLNSVLSTLFVFSMEKNDNICIYYWWIPDFDPSSTRMRDRYWHMPRSAYSCVHQLHIRWYRRKYQKCILTHQHSLGRTLSRFKLPFIWWTQFACSLYWLLSNALWCAKNPVIIM